MIIIFTTCNSTKIVLSNGVCVLATIGDPRLLFLLTSTAVRIAAIHHCLL